MHPPLSPAARRRREASETLLVWLLTLSASFALAPGVARTFAARAPPLELPRLTVDPARDPPERLRFLPGIGRHLAEAIVAHRRTHGPPTCLEDLERVPGIGPATVRRIRESREVVVEFHAPEAGGEPPGR